MADKPVTTNHVLTDDDKRHFITEGYVILPRLIPSRMVAAALKVCDTAYTDENFTVDGSKERSLPSFGPAPRNDAAVGGLFAGSALSQAAEDLLGVSNVAIPKAAQIAYRVPDDGGATTGKQASVEAPVSDVVDALGYHIDATNPQYESSASPFTMLVGVCLSPGQHVDCNHGQLVVWPRSHVLVHAAIVRRHHDGLIKLGNVLGGRLLKPDVGPPKRVLLFPGDAVLVHQRLAHAGGPNFGTTVRKNLYFRVRHARHDELLSQLMSGSVFTEYEGLHHLLNSSQLRVVQLKESPLLRKEGPG